MYKEFSYLRVRSPLSAVRCPQCCPQSACPRFPPNLRARLNPSKSEPVTASCLTTNYSVCLPVGHGGVVNSPRFICQCRKLGYRSWVIPLCILLSEPVSSRLLNSISTKLFHQNKQFNVYTTTSKQQEGSTCKNSYPIKCFITTNFDKFHREER